LDHFHSSKHEFTHQTPKRNSNLKKQNERSGAEYKGFGWGLKSHRGDGKKEAGKGKGQRQLKKKNAIEQYRVTAYTST